MSRTTHHNLLLALLAAAALTLLPSCGGGGTLACEGPSNCGGNPCCLTQPVATAGSVTLSCTSAPDACGVNRTPDFVQNRLCHSDPDCVAGGIDTTETKCCPATVMGQAAHTCTSPSRCNR